MTVDDDVEKGRPEAIRAVPVRHPGRWIAAAVVLVLIAMFVNFLLTSDALNWPSSASTSLRRGAQGRPQRPSC